MGARAQVIVAAPLAVLGCSVDEQPPVLEHAAFIDARTIELRYSEPLAPVDGINPSAHFRLSAAFVLTDDEQTVYYDLSYHFYAGGPDQAAAPAQTWPRHTSSRVREVVQGDDPAELVLTLAYPIDHYVCEELLQAAALDIPAAIHLHYAEGDAPRVTDEAGNPVVDDGAWWVSAPIQLGRQAGELPELVDSPSIACP